MKLTCPNCVKPVEVKQIGDIPYNESIYAKYILNCELCRVVSHIFIAQKNSYGDLFREDDAR